MADGGKTTYDLRKGESGGRASGGDITGEKDIFWSRSIFLVIYVSAISNFSLKGKTLTFTSI